MNEYTLLEHKVLEGPLVAMDSNRISLEAMKMYDIVGKVSDVFKEDLEHVKDSLYSPLEIFVENPLTTSRTVEADLECIEELCDGDYDRLGIDRIKSKLLDSLNSERLISGDLYLVTGTVDGEKLGYLCLIDSQDEVYVRSDQLYLNMAKVNKKSNTALGKGLPRDFEVLDVENVGMIQDAHLKSFFEMNDCYLHPDWNNFGTFTSRPRREKSVVTFKQGEFNWYEIDGMSKLSLKRIE